MKYNHKLPKLYFDKDADLKWLKDRKVGIIGYGNQGRAQALNLNDSGINVSVGLRDGSNSTDTVNKDGLKWNSIENVVQNSDIISLLVPDQVMSEIYNQNVHPYFAKNKVLLFSHGYNIHYKHIIPPKFIDVIMAAPSGPGKIVRKSYIENKGVPNLLAIFQDYSKNAEQILLAYSKAIGGTRAGSFMSTFKEETETDLFGEQTVLCGGIPKLIETAFNVLVEKGYQPIVAWFVCFYEVKLIVDLFHDKGFEFMGNTISDTAEFGGFLTGKKIVNDKVKIAMEEVLGKIKSNQFQQEWNSDSLENFPKLKKYRENQKNSLFQKTTEQILELRNMRD